MRAVVFNAMDLAIRAPARLRGVGRYPDPMRHFGPGGVAEAEAECARINGDLGAYLATPAVPAATAVDRAPLGCPRGMVGERVLFDSPLPSGHPVNDRGELRLYRADGSREGDPVLLFHHPVYQYNWNVWRWFLAPIVEHVAVAQLASPYHFGRTPPGWFPGEGTINPNPVRLYEAIRQWIGDQRAARRLLAEQMGLTPVATVGYSLGAFQSLLAASFGEDLLPIVSIASTNRYGWGLLHGPLGRPVIRAMRRVGIDADRLRRMVHAMELDRYVSALRGKPVLFLYGEFDNVDPPPSVRRLERALRPTRAVRLRAGHTSMAIFRRRIARETLAFLREVGALD